VLSEAFSETGTFSDFALARVSTISVEELIRRVFEFLRKCEYRGHSPHTLTEEQSVLEKLLRHFRETKAVQCGGVEIRQYLNHVVQDGLQRGGR
jgi:hypothetical protein